MILLKYQLGAGKESRRRQSIPGSFFFLFPPLNWVGIGHSGIIDSNVFNDAKDTKEILREKSYTSFRRKALIPTLNIHEH